MVSQFGDVSVGGAERYIDEVCDRLPGYGLELRHVFVNGKGRSADFSMPWSIASAGIHPRWNQQIDQLLSNFEPDVVYAHLTVPAFSEMVILRAASRGLPVCAFYHSDVTGPDWSRQLAGWCYKRLLGRRVLAVLACLIVSSRTYLHRSSLLSGFRGELCVAPPGVDTLFAQAERKPDKPYILFVGKVGSASKGFSLLFQAWQGLRAKGIEIDLVVAGEKSSSFERVEFVGHLSGREELAHLYASAMVTVLPSVSSAESFGMVLPEALVAGCPIITTDVGAGSDLVEPGRNGYLVPAGNVSALHDAISQSLKNQEELRAYILSNRSAYMRRFNWDKTAGKTAAILHSVACSNPSTP